MSIVVGDVTGLGFHSDQVIKFFSDHWKRKIALSVPSFYKWQFTESPADAGNDHCVVAVDDVTGDLLGVMGLNTRPFFLNQSILKGVEPTTWIVD